MQVEHCTFRQKDSHSPVARNFTEVLRIHVTHILLPNEIIFVPVARLNLYLFYPQRGDVIITWLTKGFCFSGSRMAGLTFSCGKIKENRDSAVCCQKYE